MKAEFTLSNIFWNKSLAGFFFREQSYNTFEELVDRSAGGERTLNHLDAMTDDDDIDDIEERFYNDSVEELAEYFGIELEDDDDE